MVQIVRTIAELREAVAAWHRDGLRVGLVPTMGALHAGHLSLVKEALAHTDRCVMSIFVNPTQFAPQEDLDAYPRSEAEDVEAFESAGGHVVFAPAVDEMYPEGGATSINMAGPALGLEQTFRSTHFDGVALVVAKLLLAAKADCAVFGEKDYQQLQVIGQLVADLNIDTKIMPGAIVRDSEGLALSSRNAYLSPNELETARRLNKIMSSAARALGENPSDCDGILEAARKDILGSGFDNIDYLEARSHSLRPWQMGASGRLLAAVWLGRTRLIDNCEIVPS